ncbi:MAG TPA: LysM peptidoglycan-binding domain-containing protein [Opitutaceae bacterium]
MKTLPCLRGLLLAVALLGLSGCQWLRPSPAATDATLARENSELRVERKLLQQELALVRREQDTLRRALEARVDPARAPGERETQLARELEATRRELSELRTRYVQNSAAGATDPVALARQRETEERLAAVLRDFTTMQEENNRLRGEITSVRTENEQLAKRALEAEATLGVLNLELVAQREAYGNTQRQVSALRTQLQAVVAATNGNAARPTEAREPAASGATGLSAATLSAKRNADGTVTTTAKATPPTGPARKHRVAAGDTLASIAFEYYGSVERWREIYAANSELLGDNRPLSAGMELVVP